MTEELWTLLKKEVARGAHSRSSWRSDHLHYPGIYRGTKHAVSLSAGQCPTGCVVGRKDRPWAVDTGAKPGSKVEGRSAWLDTELGRAWTGRKSDPKSWRCTAQDWYEGLPHCPTLLVVWTVSCHRPGVEARIGWNKLKENCEITAPAGPAKLFPSRNLIPSWLELCNRSAQLFPHQHQG